MAKKGDSDRVTAFMVDLKTVKKGLRVNVAICDTWYPEPFERSVILSVDWIFPLSTK